MVRSITASIVLLAGTGIALAQQAAPALRPTAPAQTAQAAPAPAQPAPSATSPAGPTASHLAIARDVVQLSGLSRSFEFIVPQYSEQLKATFATTRPEIMKDLDKTLQDLRPEFEAQRNDILNAAARVFAGRINEADLKEIAAFFKSPAGSRYVSAQPQVMEDLFGEMQAWSRRLSEFMMSRVRAEMKKKNIDM
ncbi:DUF2059 domain-containing protein [Alsobacter sp. R-9]